MPFKTFFNWLFDGKIDSKIPEPQTDDDGKIIVPDILKYNSPITHTYVISIFMKNGELNHYLNEYFNNINLRYLDKEELFYFIKKCVRDFRIGRYGTNYRAYPKHDKLFKALRDKLPYLKNDDINLLCKIIDDSEDKSRLYESLGLEAPKKKKLRKQKKKKIEKMSLEKLLEENFALIKMK
jgi:hypothetical protein